MTKLTPVARGTVRPMDPCKRCKTAMEVVSSPKNGTLDKQKMAMPSNLGCHIAQLCAVNKHSLHCIPCEWCLLELGNI